MLYARSFQYIDLQCEETERKHGLSGFTLLALAATRPQRDAIFSLEGLERYCRITRDRTPEGEI
jgi:hypothetical protein